MFNIEYMTITPYSAKKMFCLINDIDSYSEFIPGCSVSKILEYRNCELIAELKIVINGVMISLITRNFFVENKNIDISLLRGPFEYFYGYWEFVQTDTTTSIVKYISYYEFSSMLTGNIFNYFFHKVYKNIVMAFFHRAHKIYGKQILFNTYTV